MSKAPEDLLEIFRERLVELSAEYVSCGDLIEASKKLKAILVAEDWDKVVMGSEIPEWVREISNDYMELIPLANHETSNTLNVRESSRAKAGITRVEAIIADTGTLVVPSRATGDRIASLIPPVHIALIFGAVIYETLADFLENADPGLTYQFITGPSRTADIEKQLVLGVHGPLRLLVFGPG